jgi:small redox-active disulfide protein 2
MDLGKIEVLGTGCKKCQQLEANTKTALANLSLDAEVLHITDPIEIAKRGILSTPALVINGKVVAKGKVMTPQEIQRLLHK